MTLAGVSVLVARSRGQASALSERLRALGAEPVEAPAIDVVAARDQQALRAALDRAAAGAYDWVAVTSPNGAEAVCAVLGEQPLAARLAAVGRGTAQALRGHARTADLVAEGSTAQALAHELAAREPAGAILLPRADIATSVLPRLLEDAGWRVDEVEAYRTMPVRALPPAVVERLAAGDIDVVALSSSSTARNLLGLLDDRLPASVRVASIGPVTSRTCQELGLRVDAEAATQDLDGLVGAVAAAVGRG